MVERYVVLHMRSAARLLEMFFWPVMELFVWGFLSIYLRDSFSQGTGKLVSLLLTGMIFWDVLYRSQQSVSLALMEELWTRNVMNMLISPLKSWEWVLGSAVYGVIKAAVIVVTLLVMSVFMYGFDQAKAGVLPPYSVWAANLIMVAIGLFLLRRVVRY